MSQAAASLTLQSPAAAGAVRVAAGDYVALAAAGAFLFALLQPRMPTPFPMDPGAAWTALCYGFAVLVACAQVGRRVPLRPTSVDYLLGVYVVCVVATWPTSFDRAHTAFAIVRLGAQVAVFYAMRTVALRLPVTDRLVVAALTAGLAALVWSATYFHLRYGLAERLIEYPPLEWNGRQGLASAAAILFALLVGIWQQSRTWWMRASAALLILGAAVQLVFFYSRDPWVAAAAVLIAGFVVAVRRGGVVRYAATAVVVLIALWLVSTPYVVRLTRMALGLEEGLEGGITLRLAAWRYTAVIIRQHVFVGVGLDNFAVARQVLYPYPIPEVFRTDFIWGLLRTGPVHPHNLFLQQIAEVGIVGGASYIALWIAVLWLGFRVYARTASRVGLSVVYTLLAITVMNLGENMFLDGVSIERMRFHSIAWILVALVAAPWDRAHAHDTLHLRDAA